MGTAGVPEDAFGDVLARARAGDEVAWSSLYRGVAPKVTAYLVAKGVRDPDDVVGEVFLQVAQRLATFEGDEARFRSWVFTIAHHRMADDYRRRARRPLELVPDPPQAVAPEDHASAVADRLVADEVLAAIQTLTADQREVLLLRLVGGLTIDEIAERLGRQRGATKALQRRGLAALQRHLHVADQQVPTATGADTITDDVTGAPGGRHLAHRPTPHQDVPL